jgi:hypothetical protein
MPVGLSPCLARCRKCIPWQSGARSRPAPSASPADTAEVWPQLIITDAAVNIAPTLVAKVDNVQNAIDPDAAATKHIVAPSPCVPTCWLCPSGYVSE